MKKCSNPDCSYRTKFDDYLACPRCTSPLVDTRTLTGSLPPEDLSEAQTSPYVPINRLQHEPAAEYGGGGGFQYVQQPLPYQEPQGGDFAGVPMEGYADEPLMLFHSNRLGRLRTAAIAAGGLVLVGVCLVLALSLGSRFSSHPVFLNTEAVAATETVVASLRAPVNTPIPILPTIAPSVTGSETQSPANTGLDPNPNSDPNSASRLQPQASPSSPAPVIDAIMCARLDGGQPAGVTSAYHTTDPFNLAVKAQFGAGGVQNIATRWYGPDDSQIYQMKQTYSQQGTYYVGFTVSKSGPWAAGSYRADIYTNDAPQPVRSVSFKVIP
jgi:hypothetical protein